MEDIKTVRVNKYLSEVGYCSRRVADTLIGEGKVTVNGVPAAIGLRITMNDEVKVDGVTISDSAERHVYIAFNKPVGIVCTTDTELEKDNIIDYIKFPRRIFPIGRLDKDSEGLIILTSDGDIVNKILRSKNNHEKEYLVTVNKPIKRGFIEGMSNGVLVLGTMTNKCKVEQKGKCSFKIVLTQGLNRQIRRMCQRFGYKVTKLKRIRIMNIHLDIPTGQWKYLTELELKEILHLVSNSSKTHTE